MAAVIKLLWVGRRGRAVDTTKNASLLLPAGDSQEKRSASSIDRSVSFLHPAYSA
jgi:hypothetical protein